jgi:hypothetical protein
MANPGRARGTGWGWKLIDESSNVHRDILEQMPRESFRGVFGDDVAEALRLGVLELLNRRWAMSAREEGEMAFRSSDDLVGRLCWSAIVPRP